MPVLSKIFAGRKKECGVWEYFEHDEKSDFSWMRDFFRWLGCWHVAEEIVLEKSLENKVCLKLNSHIVSF